MCVGGANSPLSDPPRALPNALLQCEDQAEIATEQTAATVTKEAREPLSGGVAGRVVDLRGLQLVAPTAESYDVSQVENAA